MLSRIATVVLAASFLWAMPARAQQAQEDDFWLHAELQRPAAVAQLVAGYHPTTIWPIYRRQRWLVWFLPEEEPPLFDGKFAPPLDPDLLATLLELDKRTVPDLTKRKGTRAEVNFILLHRDALIKAAKVPAKAFAERAKDDTHLTWAHLYNEPHRHHGKVVTVEGKVHRLRKYDAPASLREKDIPFFYEAWIEGPTEGANPFACQFTRLPAAIKVAEKFESPPVVTFHGYFLGRYRYRGGEGKDFVTHLLIGPTIVPRARPADADAGAPASPLAYLVLYGIIGVIGVVTVIMVGLNLWFRRGDQQVRERIAQIQAQRAVEGLEAGSPPPETGIKPPDGNGFRTNQE